MFGSVRTKGGVNPLYSPSIESAAPIAPLCTVTFCALPLLSCFQEVESTAIQVLYSLIAHIDRALPKDSRIGHIPSIDRHRLQWELATVVLEGTYPLHHTLRKLALSTTPIIRRKYLYVSPTNIGYQDRDLIYPRHCHVITGQILLYRSIE